MKVSGRFVGLGALVAALAAAAAGSSSAGPSQVVAQSPLISTAPGLFPGFNPSVTDYVTRCQPSDQVWVSVAALPGVYVSVANGPQQTGNFAKPIDLSPGQAFDITATVSGLSETYYVRCLPSDFPTFTVNVDGPRQAAFYLMTPHRYPNPAGSSYQYVAFFDNSGVPVWWMKSAGPSIPEGAALLPNDDVIWTHALDLGAAGAEEHALDGKLVSTLDTAGSEADQHDVQLMSTGNYLMGRTFPVDGANLSACHGPSDGKLWDFELQELTPRGELLWSWVASAHIPLSEVPPDKQPECATGDAYHWNSVALDDGSYVLSFRNLDAVYDIDAATGAINWKLGGTTIPESLTVGGDKYQRTLCGQHNARVRPDGTITVFDDGTGCGRPPRGVRFAIDSTAGTATLLESVTNPNITRTICCGSAQVLPAGDWVVDWGATGEVTERAPSGATVFQLRFPQGWYTYRANPVLTDQVGIAQLRAGMDAQYPG
jgi:Arylsulfotransferase (ASST)